MFEIQSPEILKVQERMVTKLKQLFKFLFLFSWFTRPIILWKKIVCFTHLICREDVSAMRKEYSHHFMISKFGCNVERSVFMLEKGN